MGHLHQLEHYFYWTLQSPLEKNRTYDIRNTSSKRHKRQVLCLVLVRGLQALLRVVAAAGPVHFRRGLRELVRDDVGVALEVEPYRGLARYILAIFQKYAIFAQL